MPKRDHEILSEDQVRIELENAIALAGGINALARAYSINAEPIVRARKPNGAIRPCVLAILALRRRKTTYERIGKSGNGNGAAGKVL
jgi:hypothetical protein